MGLLLLHLDLIGKYAGYAVTTFVVAGAGAYFGSYIKKKAESCATHEDIDKLVDQVSAVTRATREIEAGISDGVCNRPRLWELKRELPLETVKGLAELERVLSIYATGFGAKQPGEGRSTVGLEKLWNDSLVILKRGRLMAAMISGPAIVESFEDIESFVRRMQKKYGNSPGIAHQGLPEFRKLTDVVIGHLNKDMIVIPQSSGS